jgi:N-acetylneuraminate synthase
MMSVPFIAEVSSNHSRDLARCLRFIEAAAKVGCSAVKFQLFKVRELFTPEALAHNESLRRREACELPVHFLAELSAACRAARIQFVCTPFYLAAVQELFPYVAMYKVGSYELLWDALLQECAATGKPVFVSTGMATMDEIRRAIEVLRQAGCKDLTLLHCTSAYPTAPAECNLAAIKTVREACQCSVGWSDHTVQPAVVYRAIHRWGAALVEFHLDLDGQGEEFRGGHCWLPHQIKPVIETVRIGFTADGTGEKVPAPCELADCDWRADPSDGLRPLRKVRGQLAVK